MNEADELATGGPGVDTAAAELAEEMAAREDIFREIVTETLATAADGEVLESGRTVCGSARNPLPPLLRHFTKVTLPTCPISVGGTWHTHVTPDQLLNPENSLPDFANVAFGIIDVSIVAGAESSHVVVATEDRRVLQQALVEEMGVTVTGPSQVANAIVDGTVENAPRIRRDLYRRLEGGPVRRIDTAMPDLADQIRETVFQTTLSEPVSLAVEMSGCTMYELLREEQSTRMGRVVRQGRECQQSVKAAMRHVEDGFDLTDTAVGAAVGTVVGNIVNRIIFGG